MLPRKRQDDRGKPVKLARPVSESAEDAGKFKFSSTIRDDILEFERLRNCKVAVISVAGAFRKGKSFLLNFLLRYLRALESGNTAGWIRSEDTLSDGFHWRSGSERDTTGILIWSKPFFIRKPNGEEVAVLLLDTQGTFDHQSTQQDCTTIFAFSTLLSSVQIFNISQNIQETDLHYLRLFLEFARKVNGTNGSVLQDLWFLLRDWQNPDEFDYGLNGGAEYLNRIMACDSRKPRQNQELRQELRQMFEKTSCCLLPHPGNCVRDSKFRGEISRLDDPFVPQLEQFIPRIAAPQNITVKKLNGRELTGGDLFCLLERYGRAFSSGMLPVPRSIYAATVEVFNESVARDASQFFESSMQGVFDPSKDKRYFERAVSCLADEAMQCFDSRCMDFGSHETLQARQKLLDDLNRRRCRQTSIFATQCDKIQAEQRNRELESQRRQLQTEQRDRERRMRDLNRRLSEERAEAVTRETAQRRLAEVAARQAEERRAMEVRRKLLQRQLMDQAELRRGMELQQLRAHFEDLQQHLVLNFMMQQMALRAQEEEEAESNQSCCIL